ncbi:MAG TPA: MMPL family transporter [Trebonia sp.]|nr:MMPL family transporter [Trebonia sp.]
MRVDNIFRAIGRFAVKFRWVILILWIIAAAAIPKALPSLASATQGNNSAFLPASAPSEQALNLAGPLGDSNNTTPVTVVAARTTGPLTAADKAWISGTLSSDLRRVATVVNVKELGQSTQSASVTGQGAQLQVLSDVNGGNADKLTDLVDDLRAATRSAAAPAGLQVHLAGDAAVNVDQQKQSGGTSNSVELVSLAAILIILLLIFRALLAPLVTLIPAGIAVAISGPLVGEAAQHGLKVSFLAQILMIVLVLGAGTDYNLFLVFRVREHMRRGETSKEAVVSALTKVGESITFSALTVVAALLSLLFATFQIYSNLGIPLAIGIAVALLAGLTLTPALLAIFGKATFWPTRPKAGTSSAGVWGTIATRVLKRPIAALAIGVVVFGALATFVSGYVGGGFGGSITAPAGSDSAAGTSLLAKYFPSTAANPTQLIYKLSQPVWNDPAPLVTAEQQLKASGLFTGITGPLNPVGPSGFTPAQYSQLHGAVAALVPGGGPLPTSVPAALAGKVPDEAWQLYRASAQFVSADGKTIQFQAGLTAGDPSGTAAMNATPSVRDEAARVAPTLHATGNGVFGEAPAFYDVSSISNSDLTTVIPIAIVVIGVLLAIVMRSLVAPLYLIASVAISYFASLGTAVLIFIKIGGNSGITFILPFLLFIFLLALGEDYNILVMTRIREEAHHLSLREAVSKALGVTGTTVTSAGLVLAATFAVFSFVGAQGSGGDQIRVVGLGLTIGILMDTFVVRTVLVPCVCVLLGRWNWWPSKISIDSPEGDSLSVSADALGLVDGASDAKPGPQAGAGSQSQASGEASPSVAPDGKHSLD